MILQAEKLDFEDGAGAGGIGLARMGGAAVLACPASPGDGPDARRRFAVHPVPAGTDRASALLAPRLAAALRAWEELRLELGEAVILSGTGELAALLALTALWQGACPILRIGSAEPAIEGVETVVIDADDPESDMLALAGRLEEVPAVKCVDLTGDAATVDILLEVLPDSFRMMLASERSELLTLDYYVNIHRKGAHVLARHIDPADTIRGGSHDGTPTVLDRAFRLLALEDLGRAAAAVSQEAASGSGS